MPNTALTKIVAAASLLPAAVASAAIVTTWIDPAGGDFADGSNWSAGVPGALDAALFDLPAIYAVNIAAPATVQRVIARDGSVELTLAALLDAMSSSALLPSIVVGDTAGLAPSLTLLGPAHGRFMDVASGLFGSGAAAIGPGASLDLDQVLSIGPRGAATFTVDGGSLACLRLVAAALGTGVADITVHDGMLFANDAIIVGQQGEASLVLDEGTDAAADVGIVAVQPLSSGALFVDGAGTTLDFSGTVDVGRSGTGLLSITDGAIVSVGDLMTVGTTPGSFFFPFWPPGDGMVIVDGDGSVLTVDGDLFAPLGGVGTLDVRDGGRIDVSGDLIFNTSAGTFLEFTLTAPLREPVIAIQGNAFRTAGQTAPIIIAVTLGDGFSPTSQSFALLAADNIDTTFIGSLPVAEGVDWSIAVEPFGAGEAIVVRVEPAPVFGDVDGDGVVDAIDLGIVLANWGGTGPGDLSGDGIVDGADLAIVLASWT